MLRLLRNVQVGTFPPMVTPSIVRPEIRRSSVTNAFSSYFNLRTYLVLVINIQIELFFKNFAYQNTNIMLSRLRNI